MELVEKYWRNDDRTAFVFTADHGMTDWGSHGTGMTHETEVPLIAWGAGVKHPEDHAGSNVVDVSQADIAPLMATLLATNIPKNSVGSLPSNYLKLSPADLVSGEMAVARQGFEMFLAREKSFEPFHFVPFSKLSQSLFDDALVKIQRHVQVGKLQSAQNLTQELHDLALEGVEYYRTYYRTHLYVAISVSYIGFISLVGINIVKGFMPTLKLDPSPVAVLCEWLLMIILCAVIFIVYRLQNVPIHYIIYYLTPIMIWHVLLKELISLKLPHMAKLSQLLKLVLVILVIESCVLAFFVRTSLVPCLLMTTLLQIFLSRNESWKTRCIFALLNMVLSLFALQPTIGKDRNNYLVMAGGVIPMVSVILIRSRFKEDAKTVIGLQVFLGTSVACVLLTSSWQVQGVLKVVAMALSWTILISGLPLALATTPRLIPRLLCLCLALQSAFTLLSLSYESLFLFCLMLTLLMHLQLEVSESMYR